MARLENGLVGFAAGALPGERLIVTASERKRGYVRANAFLLSERALERVPPPCIYAGKCGGCDWLHIDYSAQLRFKLEILKDALTRVGRVDPLPELTIVPASDPLRYRNRIRVHLERSKIGFLARQSHDLIDVASCAVASRELDHCLASFRAICAEHSEIADRYREAELRVVPGARRGMVRLVPRSLTAGSEPSDSSVPSALATEFDVVVAGAPSSASQRFALGKGLWLELPPDAFVQVNWTVNLAIIEGLVAEALARGIGRFADLYAGAGNFTLPLLARGCSGVAVEGSERAAAAARESVAAHGFPGEVLACDVATGLRRLIRDRRRFDLVILDPPRTGAREALPLLGDLAPGHLVYCACDPVTLARDLRDLRNAGFRLDSVRAYDMFPGTHHFETLVWMTRVSSAPPG
jgi:23S rRNA (uracil1939-C5)-methyltransferase